MRNFDLPVDQECRSPGYGNRDGERGCGSDHDMRTRAQSAPGVRHIGGRMDVRYLDRRAEKQEEGATKSNGDPPGTSRVSLGSRKQHHLQL
jgi:hypothetical protein